jgi:hypothetical protein
MSEAYKNTDVNEIAKQAEKNLNSTANVHGHSTSDSGTFFHLSIQPKEPTLTTP